MGSMTDGFAWKCSTNPAEYSEWELMTWDEACPEGIILPDDDYDYLLSYKKQSSYELLFQLDRLIVCTYKNWVDLYYGEEFKQHESSDGANGVDLKYRKIYNQEIFIISEDWVRENLPYPISNFGVIRTPNCNYMFVQGQVMGYCYEEWGESLLSNKHAFSIAFNLRGKLPEIFSPKRKVVKQSRLIRHKPNFNKFSNLETSKLYSISLGREKILEGNASEFKVTPNRYLEPLT